MTVKKEDVYKAFWWLEHQRLFFFAAFFLGAIIIFVLKSFGTPGYVVSISAISIMLAYAIAGTRSKIKIRLDVIGDNLYYLGFLFTLISLSFSLYQLGKGIADINGLLENFGLAIMTTLTGLALRVFFNQPKADVAEYENTIRLSLTEATANFIGETSKIGRDISTLRSVLNQIVEETRDAQQHATATLGRAIDEQIGLLDTSSKANQENIDALLQKIKITQNNFADNFKINSESMTVVISDSMLKIRSGAGEFVNRFSEMNNSIDELKKTMNFLNGILGTWDSTVENILKNNSKMAEQQSISSENLLRFENSIIASSSNITNSFNLFTDELAQATSYTKSHLAAKVVDIERDFNQMSYSLNGLSGDIFNVASKIKELNIQIPEAIVQQNFKETLND